MAVGLVAAFLASRAAYAAVGVRFDASPIAGYWQYIDPQLLRHDLFQSLWYLHVQPPLFNAFLGATLKAGGDSFVGAFHGAYVAAGLVMLLALYRLMRRLGAGQRTASVAAIAFMASPPIVLYENWLYVTYPVAALLVVVALLVHRYLTNGTRRDALLACGAGATVVLMTPFFHLVWLLALIGVLVAFTEPSRRRRLVMASALPMATVIAVYTKTLVQFGVFGASTCMGLNAAAMTTFHVSHAERQELVRRQVLSRYATRNPYLLPELDRASFARAPRTGVPLLDSSTKSTGAANFNATAYKRICARYLDDAIVLLRRSPGTPMAVARKGALMHMRSLSQYSLLWPENRDAIAPLDRAVSLALGVVDPVKPRPVNVVTAQQGDIKPRWSDLLQIAWIVVAGYAVAMWWVLRTLLQRTGPASRAARGTAAFVLLTVVYVAGVSTFLGGFPDNNRYRLLVEPLVFAVVVCAAANIRRLRPASDRGDWI